MIMHSTTMMWNSPSIIFPSFMIEFVFHCVDHPSQAIDISSISSLYHWNHLKSPVDEVWSYQSHIILIWIHSLNDQLLIATSSSSIHQSPAVNTRHRQVGPYMSLNLLLPHQSIKASKHQGIRDYGALFSSIGFDILRNVGLDVDIAELTKEYWVIGPIGSIGSTTNTSLLPPLGQLSTHHFVTKTSNNLLPMRYSSTNEGTTSTKEG